MLGFADQQYHGGGIKYISELEAERITVIDVVSCDQVTAEEVEEVEVSKLGRRPERDHLNSMTQETPSEKQRGDLKTWAGGSDCIS